MKCPKCSYTSFDYLKKCKKCGELLEDSRKSLNLKMGEPTLFSGLKDEPSEAGESETAKTETKVDSTQKVGVSSLSPPLSDQLPVSPVPEKRPVEDLSESVSSGLGTLGSMDGLEPRSNEKKTSGKALKVELESTAGATNGFELSPSFDADDDRTVESPAGDKNPKDEFVLLADDEKLEIDEPLKNDVPFEFSASDLESDIDLEISSDNPDKDFIELELDMNDEESLDQILADLDPKK